MPEYKRSHYDLLEIKWGDEVLRARPVEWDKDITAFDFNPETDVATVTKYETVCPKCGNACSFLTNSPKVECENCRASADLSDYVILTISSEQVEPRKEEIDKVNNELDIELEKILEERDNELAANGPEDIIDSLTKSIMDNEEDLIEEKPKPKKKKGK